MYPSRPDTARIMTPPNEADDRINRPDEPAKTRAPLPAVVPSEDLLRGHKTVDIEHNGTVYRLQSTRAGKLILTK